MRRASWASKSCRSIARGSLERLQDRVAGDLGEGHPLRSRWVDAQAARPRGRRWPRPRGRSPSRGSGRRTASAPSSARRRGARSPRAPRSRARSRARRRRPARRTPCPGPGCAHTKLGRRSRRPGTSRSSSPWRAIRRPRASSWPCGHLLRVDGDESSSRQPAADGTTGSPFDPARHACRSVHRDASERAGTSRLVSPSPGARTPVLAALHDFAITDRWRLRLPGHLRADGCWSRPACRSPARSRCCSAAPSRRPAFAAEGKRALALLGRVRRAPLGNLVGSWLAYWGGAGAAGRWSTGTGGTC